MWGNQPYIDPTGEIKHTKRLNYGAEDLDRNLTAQIHWVPDVDV